MSTNQKILEAFVDKEFNGKAEEVYKALIQLKHRKSESWEGRFNKEYNKKRNVLNIHAKEEN